MLKETTALKNKRNDNFGNTSTKRSARYLHTTIKQRNIYTKNFPNNLKSGCFFVKELLISKYSTGSIKNL